MVDILGRILRMRCERHWTEYELGKRADISQGTISTWYRRNQIPNLATLDRICQAFGVTLSQLVAEDGDPVVLTQEDMEFLELYQCMNENQRKHFIEFMKSLKEDDESSELSYEKG
ncbi:MAG: helix-turn-helix domain-containing protein [Lachnospiraceae bacterium]